MMRMRKTSRAARALLKAARLLLAKKPQPVKADVLLPRIKSMLYKFAASDRQYKAMLKSSSDWKPDYEEWKQAVTAWIEKDVKASPNGQIIRIVVKEYRPYAVTGPSMGTVKFLDKELDAFARRYGWYLQSGATASENEDNHGREPVEVNWSKPQSRVYRLYPYYGERVKVPAKLFHVSPIENTAGILRKGLVPRSGRKVDLHERRQYPTRVYLATSYEFAKKLVDAFNQGNYEDALFGGRLILEPYSIFEIDTSQLSKGTKFYRDEEEPKNSVWTYSGIPAKALKLTEQSQKAYDEYLEYLKEEDW